MEAELIKNLFDVPSEALSDIFYFMLLFFADISSFVAHLGAYKSLPEAYILVNSLDVCEFSRRRASAVF